jgi:serine/threonine protein kinase
LSPPPLPLLTPPVSAPVVPQRGRRGSAQVSGKPNVKRATLRGAARGAARKILKEYGVSEFKRVKRAVAAAGRLRHPGIVPVECAFLEPRGDIVVVQSALYAGGNMRQWARGQPPEARLRAAQRVAEAVRFLHAHAAPILHRDIKPENVVFAGTPPTRNPPPPLSFSLSDIQWI